MMRLETNRNAARLRRHKRRLQVMDKEKVELESAKRFLSKLKFIEQRDFTQVFGYPTREVLTRVERSSNYSPLKKQVFSVPELNFGHYTGNQDYFGTESTGRTSVTFGQSPVEPSFGTPAYSSRSSSRFGGLPQCFSGNNPLPPFPAELTVQKDHKTRMLEEMFLNQLLCVQTKQVLK